MSFAQADIDKIKDSEDALHALRTVFRDRRLFNFQVVILEKTLGRPLTMEDIRGHNLSLHWQVKLPHGPTTPNIARLIPAPAAPKLEAPKPKEQSLISLILLGAFGFMIFVPAKLMPVLLKVLLGSILALGTLAIVIAVSWLGVFLVRFFLRRFR